MSKFWNDELEKFRAAKRKSAVVTDLLSVSERMATKITSLETELQELKTAHEKKVKELEKQIKDRDDELSIAWKND